MVTQLEAPPVRPRANKRWLAMGITVFVLGLATVHWLPTSIAVLLGVVLLVIDTLPDDGRGDCID